MIASENRSIRFLTMEQFQSARCIDSRDKAFALCGLARDGHDLLPSYIESTADIYFRILSMLPTEGVRPPLSGYRWPHQAASRLQNCLQLTKRDLLSSLECNQSYQDRRSIRGKDDRLYTVFEYTGIIVQEALRGKRIRSTFHPSCSLSFEVRLQDFANGIFYGNATLRSGGLVYSLQR